MKTQVIDLVGKLAQARVAVVGDVMLDRFIYGDIERISPEAPIPVLRVNRVSAMLGGAGNVAANVASLGARIILVGLLGEDEDGAVVRQLVSGLHGAKATLLCYRDRRTVVKTRVVEHWG